MALKIDRVQLQFEIKLDYDQQQLQKLEEDLKKANRALSQTEREIEKLKNKKPTDPAAMAKWEKDLSALNQKYREQVTAVQSAQKAIDKHISEMKLENLSLGQLTKRAQTLNTILRNLNPNSPAYAQYKAQLDQITARIKELKGQAVSTRLSLAKLADGFNRYSMLVGSALASMTGLVLTIRKCTNAYAEMEDTMASVRKYTGQTDEQVREMNEEFKEMDTRSSREQLNELAGAAGRLGLTSKQAIMEFVDGADKIGVALGDDLGKGAVDTIGKLAIAFGEDDRLGLRGAMLATGSALNEIVQNSPAHAQPVVEFTERLGGVGQQAHLTQAQIMGFGAALDQNSQEMATSATVMSQLITKMYKDPARFANMAGMEVKKFADLVKTDMNQALVEWLQHVNKLGDMSVLASKFDDLKMDGSRAISVLPVLAGHIDQVTTAQRIATDAYEEGTSVINEFDVQNTTVAAELDKAKKRFADITIELGEKLMPIARHAITTTSAGVRILSNIVEFTSKWRLAILAVTVALAAFVVVEKAHVAQQKLIAFWNNTIVAGTKKLWAVLVAHPYLAVAGAVAVLAGIMADLIRRSNEVSAAQKAMADVEKDATVEAEKERLKLEQLRSVVHDNNRSLEERHKAIEDIKKIVPEYVAKISEEGKVYDENTEALDRYIQKLKEQAMVKGAEKKIEEMGTKWAELEAKRLEQEQKEEKRRKRAARGPQGAMPGSVGIWSNQAQEAVAEGAGQQILNSIKREQDELKGAMTRMGEVVKGAKKLADSSGDGDGGNGGNGGGGYGGSGGGKTATDPYQVDLSALERNRREVLNILKQSLVDEQITETEYQEEQTTQQMANLQAKLTLQQKYDKDTTETEGQMLDLLLNEANKKHQQQLQEEKDNDQQRLQQRKQLLNEMQQAEKDALDKGSKADTAQEAETFFAEALHQADLMRSLDLINFEDYEKRKTAIAEAQQKKQTELTKEAEQQRMAIREAYTQQAQQMMSSVTSLFSALQGREESRVDAKYKKLIAYAKKNGRDTTKLEEQQENEKLAIKKKYADKQFAMTVLQIISNLALGISKIWAEWGWNPPVAIGLSAAESAVSAVQLATAKAQRDQAAGLYRGGFSDEYAEGYTGDGNPRDMAGVIPVHKREFVINHQAMQVPAVQRIASVIDSMQKRKSYHMQDTTRQLQMAVATGGLSRSGYSGSSADSVSVPQQSTVSTQRLENLMERNNNLLDQMLESGMTILELRRQIKKQEQLEKNASR